MDSYMLKKLKNENPDKQYPSNLGQKWTHEEEITLLEELSKDIDIEIIAQNHNRTTGGINARRKEIAYKMYLKEFSIEEIIQKTKLDDICIKQTVHRRGNGNYDVKKEFSIENEIKEIKNDIKELKNTVKELVELMKAVYEFEDA